MGSTRIDQDQMTKRAAVNTRAVGFFAVFSLITAISKTEPPEQALSTSSTLQTTATWYNNTTHNSYYLTTLELMTRFSSEMGICDMKERSPTTVKTSCVGRCRLRGQVNSNTTACSCDLWCKARGTCCYDFLFVCDDLFRAYSKNYLLLGLHSACETDGIRSVRGCFSYSPSQPDLSLLQDSIFNTSFKASHTIADVHARLGSSTLTLKDFLGGSTLKIKELYIKDSRSQLVFKTREAFSSCRIPDAEPDIVPRRVDLTCLRTTDQDVQLLQAMTTDDYQTQLKILNSYLQGCTVLKVAEEGLSKHDECYSPAFINCFDQHGREACSSFSDLCAGSDATSSSSWDYIGPPDLLMSRTAFYVALAEGTHCFYTLPKNVEIEKQFESRLAHDVTVTIQAKSWYSRISKDDSIILPLKYSHKKENSIQVQGFFISIRILSIPHTFYLDCETLDTSLEDCESFELEDFMFRKQSLESDYVAYDEASLWRQYSLGAKLQRVASSHKGHLDPATVHQHGIAMCSCLRVQMAFTRLNELSATVVNLDEDRCVLQLRPNLTDLTEEKPTFKTLLGLAENSIGELEQSLNQTKNLCEQDPQTEARLCLYPIISSRSASDPPASTNLMRYFYIDLTGRGHRLSDAVLCIGGNVLFLVILFWAVLLFQIV